ncbi:MAG: T9SS type A sorting domain-containing protein [Dyadobacter sp.]|uniref:T9SS type A sorting domain-containing protein n=1 Tax=Dyadobacter sp. TaxID=1914288 RepID=UPI00326328EA
MKPLFSFGLAIIVLSMPSFSKAQFTSGVNGLFMKGTAVVAIDGLTIAPNADITLNNKTLQVLNTPIPGSPTNSIRRVYTFNEAFNFTGTLGVFYLPSELNGNIEASLQIATSSAAGTSYVISNGSTVDQSKHYIFNSFNGTNLRGVSAMQAGSVLPVTLVSFTAKIENETALLQWSTSFETNSAFFEIQRSLNGKEWHAIGQVAAGGESKSMLHYAFKDPSPIRVGQSKGENLYRLKMIDADETFAYSAVRSVQFEGLNEIALFPNPAMEKVQITVEDWNKVECIYIVNAAGKPVYESISSQLTGISANGIPVKHLPTGLYFVKIMSNNGQVHSLKMMKY